MKPIVLENISNSLQLLEVLSSPVHKSNLCVVMFTASWCGPCKNIKHQIYNDQSESGICDMFPNTSFFYIDIDNNDIANEFKISAVPVFYFLTAKNGGIEFVVDKISGGNRDRLVSTLRDATKEIST